MAGDAAKKRATYEDLRNLPENVTGEILDGELYTSPRPKVEHIHVTTMLSSELIAPFRLGRGGPGGWVILVEPEIHLEGNAFVPDLAGWKKERLPIIDSETPAVEVVPDWICEVRSSSTARKDMMVKLPLYARYGVPWIWIIDPDGRVIIVYSLTDGKWQVTGIFGGPDKVRIPPFEQAELDLSLLWIGEDVKNG